MTPEHLPLFPLGTVLFPGMPLPLQIFEERYRRLLRDQAEAELVFGVVCTASGREVGDEPAMYRVGTAASLVNHRVRRDGRADIIVLGVRRFRVLEEDWSRGYCVGQIDWLDEQVGTEATATQARERVALLFGHYVRGVVQLTDQQFDGVALSDDLVEASYDLASRLPLHTWERQSLLECDSASERFSMLEPIVRREVSLLHKAGAAGLALNHPGGVFAAN